MRIDIKPLSVNDAWQGRRFKTPAYKIYERDILRLLRPLKIPDGNLHVTIEWGFSSAGSDIDNPAKLFIDCLQKKYLFNDSRIHQLTLTKVKTPKRCEYIKFSISAC